MARRKDYEKKRRNVKIRLAASLIFFFIAILFFIGAVYQLGKVDGLVTAYEIIKSVGCVC